MKNPYLPESRGYVWLGAIDLPIELLVEQHVLLVQIVTTMPAYKVGKMSQHVTPRANPVASDLQLR